MQPFERIIAVFLVMSVFSANAMNWFGRRDCKKSFTQKIALEEYVMDDMVGEVNEVRTKAGLCPIELENERRYDRSIYEVGATIAQKKEWVEDYLKNFTQIMQDFSTFNKKRKKNELLKTISVSFLKQTIDFITTKENGALENYSACVDEFFKAVEILFYYCEPSENLFKKNMSFKYCFFSICRIGSKDDMIRKQYFKSRREHRELEKLIYLGPKIFRLQKAFKVLIAQNK